MVDSISYIPLETSEKCLLGELQRTKRDGDFYSFSSSLRILNSQPQYC